MERDKEVTAEDWGNLIDDAKKREAINDLSIIAYRLLTTHISLKEKIKCLV